MAKYQQYEEYKDSGVEWLGEIPTKWKVTALKRYCNVKGGYAFASDTFSNAGEPVIRIGDIKADGSISLEGCKFISTELAKSSHAYLVEKGQLLMAMTGATIGKAGVYINDRPAYLNQRVGKFVIDNDEMNYSFLWYTLKTNGYQEYIKLTAFGGAQPNISDTGMVDYISCFPSLSEQTQIANFLDHETAQIDTLIKKQQTLIQLLKEKRQAVISHAVTKGLNPDAPMKDSGVEWLGEVPEHWINIQLGRVCRQVSDGPHFSPAYVDEGVMFLSARNIGVDAWYLDDAKFISEKDYKEFCRRVVPEKGDVLYTKGGTTGVARVVDLVQPFQVWVHVAVLKLRLDLINPNYAVFVLNSIGCYEQSQLHTRGATNQDLGLTRMVKIWFALPSIEEQDAILDFLNQKVSKIDALINNAYTGINLLKERRTALISAAVTGKIDVRGWRASE